MARSSLQVLTALAHRLNREARAGGLPPLLFLTDPARTPEATILAIAERLPRGCGLIYRHFGAPERHRLAKSLARICRRRGLILLIAADAALARTVRAQGVHWPERMLKGRRLKVRAARSPMVTAAAHSAKALRRAKMSGADAALLSPLFPSRSQSAGRPLGPLRAGLAARAAGLPVYALGGVTAKAARRLLGRGFAGLAAIDGVSVD